MHVTPNLRESEKKLAVMAFNIEKANDAHATNKRCSPLMEQFIFNLCRNIDNTIAFTDMLDDVMSEHPQAEFADNVTKLTIVEGPPPSEPTPQSVLGQEALDEELETPIITEHVIEGIPFPAIDCTEVWRQASILLANKGYNAVSFDHARPSLESQTGMRCGIRGNGVNVDVVNGILVNVLMHHDAPLTGCQALMATDMGDDGWVYCRTETAA